MPLQENKNVQESLISCSVPAPSVSRLKKWGWQGDKKKKDAAKNDARKESRRYKYIQMQLPSTGTGRYSWSQYPFGAVVSRCTETISSRTRERERTKPQFPQEKEILKTNEVLQHDILLIMQSYKLTITWQLPAVHKKNELTINYRGSELSMIV